MSAAPPDLRDFGELRRRTALELFPEAVNLETIVGSTR